MNRVEQSSGSSAGPAAAAAAIPPLPQNPLTVELVKRGVDQETANGYCRCRDHDLIREVIDFFDEWVRRPTMRNKFSAGPLYRMLDNPDKWKFKKVDGVWQPPPDSSKHRRRREAERRLREAEERRCSLEEAAEERRRNPPLSALPRLRAPALIPRRPSRNTSRPRASTKANG